MDRLTAKFAYLPSCGSHSLLLLSPSPTTPCAGVFSMWASWECVCHFKVYSGASYNLSSGLDCSALFTCCLCGGKVWSTRFPEEGPGFTAENMGLLFSTVKLHCTLTSFASDNICMMCVCCFVWCRLNSAMSLYSSIHSDSDLSVVSCSVGRLYVI